ncbi:MAG: hypothetical protein E6I75_27835 [Chloroflexi bacterium]|nr:MAG: hypothetical protein E6I75_27835 [Chloroflexota bacterium]
MLTREAMRFYWRLYLPNEADADDCRASPLRARSFSNLPPALVITAEFDPLRDEGRAYADRLREAGTQVVYREYPGMVHGFATSAGVLDAARQAILLARRGGRVVLAGSTGPGRELSGVDLSTIVRGHLDIYGSLANPRGISRRGLELIARRAVDVRPLITHCFALDDFAEAWATFVERRDGAIRVMLHP